MKKTPVFPSALIVQSWFKEKTQLFSLPSKMGKKSKDFTKNHICLLIKIPYVNPLIRNLLLNEYPLARSNKQKKYHTFQQESSMFHLAFDSSENFINHSSSDQNPFPKQVVDQPLKEHLLATKRLEQSQRKPHSDQKNSHQISVFPSQVSEEESKEPFPHDWIFQRKEERQFQVDRVIKYPTTR